MAKVKKAQLGDHLVKRKSQDDRIHRIEKKDPERAERVADRVQKRALRSVKPSSVKPIGKSFIPLRERAKAAKAKKYQLGGLIKGIVKSGVKKAEKTAVKNISEAEMKQAFNQMERNRLKSMFKDIDAKEAAKAAAKKTVPKKKLGGKVKKAQAGDSLIYESKGVRYPKRRIAVDTAGYAGGKKSFKATSKYLEDLGGNPKEYPEKPKKYGRSVVKAILKTKGVTPKKKAGGSVKKKIVKK